MSKKSYRHPLPKDGPGYQAGTDIRRIRWTLRKQAKDEAIQAYIDGAIDAIGLVFIEHMAELEQRLIAVHSLFTERQIATIIQAKWFQIEVEKTEAVLAKSRTFRKELETERNNTDTECSGAAPSSGCAEEPGPASP